MKIKLVDATPRQLDWIVAEIEGWEPYLQRINAHEPPIYGLSCRKSLLTPSFCSDPSQAWPIIEREGILIRPLRRPGHVLHGKSLAMYDPGNTGTMVQWVKRTDWPRHYWQGSTALVAAMRCYVASRLGDEVEVPEDLK